MLIRSGRILLAAAALVLVPVAAVSAAPTLSYPVEDARADFAQGHYEFVGIQLADTLELPGLKEAQIREVEAKYRIRPLNRRWQTFANVEHDPAKLQRLRSYCIRYNLTLWQALEKKRRDEAFRYRY